MNKLIRWKRGSDGYLFLQVLQTDSENNPSTLGDNSTWVSYTQATHRKPDYNMPGIRTSKGFATAQKYLRLGYSYVKFEENYAD